LPHRFVDRAHLLREIAERTTEFALRHRGEQENPVKETVYALYRCDIRVDERRIDNVGVFFAVEMVVEIALRHLGGIKDILDAGIIEPLGMNELSGLIENFLFCAHIWISLFRTDQSVLIVPQEIQLVKPFFRNLLIPWKGAEKPGQDAKI